ncbi:hypothetical protein HDU93_002916 [Gonapodya sp. JEL0774]|nr:hypothetical protein HDU93_002916 [Gonapodya sp. JEL0774]
MYKTYDLQINSLLTRQRAQADLKSMTSIVEDGSPKVPSSRLPGIHDLSDTDRAALLGFDSNMDGDAGSDSCLREGIREEYSGSDRKSPAGAERGRGWGSEQSFEAIGNSRKNVTDSGSYSSDEDHDHFFEHKTVAVGRIGRMKARTVAQMPHLPSSPTSTTRSEAASSPKANFYLPSRSRPNTRSSTVSPISYPPSPPRRKLSKRKPTLSSASDGASTDYDVREDRPKKKKLNRRLSSPSALADARHTSDDTLNDEDGGIAALPRSDTADLSAHVEMYTDLPSPHVSQSNLPNSPGTSSDSDSDSAGEPESPKAPRASTSGNEEEQTDQTGGEDHDPVGDDAHADVNFSEDEGNRDGAGGVLRKARASSKKALLEMKKETDRLSRLTHVELVPTVANKRSLKDMIGGYLEQVSVAGKDHVSGLIQPALVNHSPSKSLLTPPTVGALGLSRPRLTVDAAAPAPVKPRKPTLTSLKPKRYPTIPELDRATLRKADDEFELVVVKPAHVVSGGTLTLGAVGKGGSGSTYKPNLNLTRAEMERMIEEKLKEQSAKAREARELESARKRERAERKKKKREEEEERRREEERERGGDGFRRLKKLGNQSAAASATSALPLLNPSLMPSATPSSLSSRDPFPPSVNPTNYFSSLPLYPDALDNLHDVGGTSDSDGEGAVFADGGSPFPWSAVGEDARRNSLDDVEMSRSTQSGGGSQVMKEGLQRLFEEGTQVEEERHSEPIFDRLRTAVAAEQSVGRGMDATQTQTQTPRSLEKSLGEFFETTQLGGTDQHPFEAMDRIRAQAVMGMDNLSLSQSQRPQGTPEKEDREGLVKFFEETQAEAADYGGTAVDAMDRLRADAMKDIGELSFSHTQESVEGLGTRDKAAEILGTAASEVRDPSSRAMGLTLTATQKSSMRPSDAGEIRAEATQIRANCVTQGASCDEIRSPSTLEIDVPIELERLPIRLRYSIENSLDPFVGSQTLELPPKIPYQSTGGWTGPLSSSNALMPPDIVQVPERNMDDVEGVSEQNPQSPESTTLQIGSRALWMPVDKEALKKEKERQRKLAEKQKAAERAMKMGGSILNFFGKEFEKNAQERGGVQDKEVVGKPVSVDEEGEVEGSVRRYRRAGTRKRFITEDEEEDNSSDVEIENSMGLNGDLAEEFEESEEEAEMTDGEDSADSSDVSDVSDADADGEQRRNDENEDESDDKEEAKELTMGQGVAIGVPVPASPAMAHTGQMHLGHGLGLLNPPADGYDDEAPKLAKRRNKKKSIFLATEAEEEDDEFMGLGGQDGEIDTDEEDAKDLEGLIAPETGEVMSFDDIMKLHRQQMKEKDDQDFNNLLQDVTTGNLRKRRRRGLDGKGFDIDSSDEDELFGGAWKKLAEKYAKRRMNDDDEGEELTAVERYAANPVTAAFAKAFEWGNRDDDDFLGERLSSEVDVPNGTASPPTTQHPPRIDFVMPDGDIIGVQDDEMLERSDDEEESEPDSVSEDDQSERNDGSPGKPKKLKRLAPYFSSANAVDDDHWDDIASQRRAETTKTRSAIDGSPNDEGTPKTALPDVENKSVLNSHLSVDFLSIIRDRSRDPLVVDQASPKKHARDRSQGSSIGRFGMRGTVEPGGYVRRAKPLPNTAKPKRGGLLNHSPSKLNKLAESFAKEHSHGGVVTKTMKTFTFGKQETNPAPPKSVAHSRESVVKSSDNQSVLLKALKGVPSTNHK